MNRRMAIGLTALVWCIAAAVGADTISGNLFLYSTVTHSGGTASTLTETLGTLWYWDNATGAIGTNTTANDLNYLYVANASIAAGETNSLDLYGVLKDSFGSTLNFARIKMLVIAPTNTIAGTFIVRPAASAGFTNWCADAVEGVRVRTGGAMAIFAPDGVGYRVENGVCDTLEIVNTITNAGTCKIVIAGE